MTNVPELIAEGQTTEEGFLRQIFVRDRWPSGRSSRW
jgi:hypothetical protein